MRITELAGKGIRLLFTAIRWVLGAIALLIFVTLALSLYQQSRVMRSIEQGMTQAEVVAELGEPRLELVELGFCRDNVWLGDCEAARQSGAVRYLVWKYGIDTWFVVGLDGDSRVVFYDMGDA